MTWDSQANSIFLDALEIESTEDRSAFVERSCAHQPDLQREVFELLAAYQQAGAGEFLERPVCSMSPGLQDAPGTLDTRDATNDSSISALRRAGSGVSPEPPPLPDHSPFGRYQIERVLGRGGMGVVYLATDTRLNRRVALKIPRFSDQPELVERFAREAQTMAAVSHRHLCAIHDVGEIDGVRYLSLAYIDGQTLGHLLQQGKRFSSEQIVELMAKLAQATHRAHQAGVVHRDLKPVNVMIDHEGEPVIMDFGLALGSPADARITHSGLIMGTPAYMAPEQARGDSDEIGAASDIYSLGAIMYELLTGRPAYTGSVSLVLGSLVSGKPVAPPRSVRADVDPALEAICLKAMSRRPESRYASAGEFASALEQYRTRILPWARKAAPQDARPVWQWLAATVLFVLAAGTILINIQTPHGTLLAEIHDDAIAAQAQGQKLTIRDLKLERTYELTLNGRESTQSLPAGRYAIQVAEPDSGLTLSASTFSITRADRRPAVTVRFQPAQAIASAPAKSQVGTRLTKWSEPEELGPGVNTVDKEENACIAADGLTLIFNRNVENLAQLWESNRANVDESFGLAKPLPEPINLAGYDHRCPFLSGDGLSLWFSSNRPGGFGQHDLWVSRRTSATDLWGEPVNLGPLVNSKKYEQSPWVSPDELTLLLSCDEPRGVFRILRANRSSPDGPFEKPKLLANVNDGVCSSFPRLTRDGLAMVFVHCPSRDVPLKLFCATRQTIESDFDAPVELDSNINSLPATGPSLSADGRRLYFCRQRDDSFDLWSATLAQ